MNTNALIGGIVGFLLGGLVVSFAATQLDTTTHQSASDQSMSQMTADLKDKQWDDFDKAFVAAMIMHHEGAIEMAKLSASQAKHDEVKALSQEIIAAQEGEITKMRQWQQLWGYDTNDDMHTMSH